MSLYGIELFAEEEFGGGGATDVDMTVAVDAPTPDVDLTYTVARGFLLDVDAPEPDVAIAWAIERLFSVDVDAPTPSVGIEWGITRVAPMLEEQTMINRLIRVGATSQILTVAMRATNGSLQGGLTHSDVTAKYIRDGQAASATTITLTSGMAGTWSSGGWVAQGGQDGIYQLGVPDAAFTSGATGVTIVLSASGCLDTVVPIQLVAFNPQDTVRMGMTALPNATAGAENGVPVLDSDSKVAATVTGATLHSDYDAAKTAASAAALATVGQNVDSILEDTSTTIPGLLSALDTRVDDVIADTEDIQNTLATLNDVSAADVVAALLAEEVDSTTITNILTRLLAYVSGNVVSTGSDPHVDVYKAADGSTTVMTHSIEADGSARTVTTP